ncbi:MAG: PKD domain-containing protein [Gemmatimonadetes bacterium]|nr:PKD domain-containing protein [Gemmatimonadota bacterium]
MRRRLLLLVPALVAGFITACQDQGPTAVDQPQIQASVGQAVPGEWIVVFKNDVPDAPGLARQLVASHGGQLRFTYQYALKGFAASLPDAAVQALQRNPNVAFVEPDQVVYASATQTGATWGLDRIDQRDLPLNSTYTYDYTGSGVTAYIIDTGILLTHNEFGGRAVDGYDAVDGTLPAADCNGHGTHVAGTVGGTTYGVAKGVSLVAVRVLNCSGSGTTAGVIAGINWVTANAKKPAVANMSLGGGISSSLDVAVQNSIAAGVSYAVAAGNSNADACNYSPARVAQAMTIGASTSTDARASYSNYGSCVDWFAPGSSITSAWYTSNTATNTISGTSMATPHTAGVAALYLQANPSSPPQQVRDALYAATTKSKVSSSNSTNNHLLYSLVSGTPLNSPPTASFTAPACTVGVACNFTDASTDADGTIAARSWDFGDATPPSTAPDPSHTYAAAGTYTVTLTVTDDDGASNSISKQVTVSTTPPPSAITLSVTAYKVKNVKKAELTWSGATSTNVDVYRTGVIVKTVANTGAYTDLPFKTTTTATYKVCEAGTTTCSNSVTVTW